MGYKQIIFDIDGTLLDNEYAILHSMQDVVFQFTGKKFPVEELTFALGITGEDALDRLGIADKEPIIRKWLKIMEDYENTISVYEGIGKLLCDLKEAGYKLGIVSSKTRKEFEHDFSHFPISGYFETVVCADDTVEHKPAPAPLLKYMEKSGTEKGEVLYVGDSVYDGKCAENAGVDFALAVWGSHNRQIPAKFYPEEPADLFIALQP